MKDYRFTLAANQTPERVPARAAFFRYFKETSGATATRIILRTDNGSSFVMEPGDYVEVQSECQNFEIINALATQPLDGIILHGGKDEKAGSSNLQLGGAIATTETRATGVNASGSATVGTASGAIIAATAANRRGRLYAPKTNSDSIYLVWGGGAATIAGAQWKLDPGESLMLDIEAAMALAAISGTAAQKLNYIYFS